MIMEKICISVILLSMCIIFFNYTLQVKTREITANNTDVQSVIPTNTAERKEVTTREPTSMELFASFVMGLVVGSILWITWKKDILHLSDAIANRWLS